MELVKTSIGPGDKSPCCCHLVEYKPVRLRFYLGQRWWYFGWWRHELEVGSCKIIWGCLAGWLPQKILGSNQSTRWINVDMIGRKWYQLFLCSKRRAADLLTSWWIQRWSGLNENCEWSWVSSTAYRYQPTFTLIGQFWYFYRLNCFSQVRVRSALHNCHIQKCYKWSQLVTTHSLHHDHPDMIYYSWRENQETTCQTEMLFWTTPWMWTSAHLSVYWPHCKQASRLTISHLRWATRRQPVPRSIQTGWSFYYTHY